MERAGTHRRRRDDPALSQQIAEILVNRFAPVVFADLLQLDDQADLIGFQHIVGILQPFCDLRDIRDAAPAAESNEVIENGLIGIDPSYRGIDFEKAA
ncbi:hypothetical protein HHL26_13800 [Sphingobium sp. TB-6]|uniref:hypothetical protein n=1 Tax=Sphingobium sp. TB-6 TaxID=2728850 RepID=UPI00146E0FC0|nr:hypothetical protein [Sphingobium sp. TB-6]NML90128.1 hypothetical protein [Sphingobium sp. TB-6]